MVVKLPIEFNLHLWIKFKIRNEIFGNEGRIMGIGYELNVELGIGLGLDEIISSLKWTIVDLMWVTHIYIGLGLDEII